MKRRLYIQIYLHVLIVSVAVLVGTGLVLRFLWFAGPAGEAHLNRRASELALHLEEKGTAGFSDLARELGVHASLWSEEGERLAGSRPPRWRHEFRPGPPGGATRPPRHRFALELPLSDGRSLRVAPLPRRRAMGPVAALALLGIAVALGAYPVARRITRRLERLQEGVERLGAGELSTRIEMDGSDEVAVLADSFNRSADRIEELVEAQRRILSHASHELRTPLARLQVALELLGEASPRTDLRDEARASIEELDGLIEDLLLAARIQSGVETTPEEIELHELIRDEAQREGGLLSLSELRIRGFPRELRRLIRNLIENAYSHGQAAEDRPVEIELTEREGGGVRLRVMDRGPGVPEDRRESIFEPFQRGPVAKDQERANVGLGLSLVREIARHHGGSARCRAREGGGAIFEVELAEAP